MKNAYFSGMSGQEDNLLRPRRYDFCVDNTLILIEKFWNCCNSQGTDYKSRPRGSHQEKEFLKNALLIEAKQGMMPRSYSLRADEAILTRFRKRDGPIRFRIHQP